MRAGTGCGWAKAAAVAIRAALDSPNIRNFMKERSSSDECFGSDTWARGAHESVRPRCSGTA